MEGRPPVLPSEEEGLCSRKEAAKEESASQIPKCHGSGGHYIGKEGRGKGGGER